MGLLAVGLELVVSREAARRGVVRHVALGLAERPEHSDEGEDLQLADHRDPRWKVVLLLVASATKPRYGNGKRVCSSWFGDAKALVARRSRGKR